MFPSQVMDGVIAVASGQMGWGGGAASLRTLGSQGLLRRSLCSLWRDIVEATVSGLLPRNSKQTAVAGSSLCTMPVDIRPSLSSPAAPEVNSGSHLDTRGGFTRPALCMRAAPRDETRRLSDRHATFVLTTHPNLDQRQGGVEAEVTALPGTISPWPHMPSAIPPSSQI